MTGGEHGRRRTTSSPSATREHLPEPDLEGVLEEEYSVLSGPRPNSCGEPGTRTSGLLLVPLLTWATCPLQRAGGRAGDGVNKGEVRKMQLFH